MAGVVLDCCGDIYSTSELSKRWTVTGSPVVSSTAGRRDGPGISLPTASDRVGKSVASLSTYVVGVAFKLDTLIATDVITLKEGSTNHLTVQITAAGAIRLLLGAAQIDISAAGLIFSGFYQYLEIEATIDDAAGAYDIDLNGVNILTDTVVDTNNAGALGEIDNVEIEGSTGVLSIDDFYIADTTGAAPQNTRFGDTAVYAVLPAADGTVNNFETLIPTTPTTSFDKVDDITPDGDTSLVASAVPGNQELFDMNDLPDPGGTSAIFSVQLGLYARKNLASFQALKGITHISATDYDGTTLPLTTTYEYNFHIWDEDPNAVADWTEAGVNAAEFGAEIP
jgi:hypothetical protein